MDLVDARLQGLFDQGFGSEFSKHSVGVRLWSRFRDCARIAPSQGIGNVVNIHHFHRQLFVVQRDAEMTRLVRQERREAVGDGTASNSVSVLA